MASLNEHYIQPKAQDKYIEISSEEYILKLNARPGKTPQ